MRILFLNQHYGPETPVTGVLLDQIARGLRARGHAVTVVAGAEPGQKPLFSRAQEQGVEVIRVRAISVGDKRTHRRLLHYASYFLLALTAGLRCGPVDAVVCLSTPPLLAPLLARLIAAWRKVPWFYDIQDLYPDVAVAKGKIPPALAGATLRFARLQERSAAGVAAVGERVARRVEHRAGRPVVALPNWADPEEIVPLAPEQSLRALWKLEDRFVVLYAGNLGLCHDAETMAAVIDLLADQPMTFVFVGTGAGRATLESRLGRHADARFFDFQPRERLSRVLATADVGWVNLQRGMSRFLVPTKTHGIMAAARPLLAVSDAGDDLYRLVQRTRAGVWAPAGAPDQIARALLALSHDAAAGRAMGRRGRRYVNEEWNRARAVAAWERWITGKSAARPGTAVQTGTAGDTAGEPKAA